MFTLFHPFLSRVTRLTLYYVKVVELMTINVIFIGNYNST